MRSERFSEEKEIKRAMKSINGHAGPVTYMDENGNTYVNDDQSNVIFYGITGGGKTAYGTQGAVLSMINNDESFVVIDPKGDLHKETYCFAKDNGYNIHVVSFRDLKYSEGINILSLPYQLYNSDDIDSIALANDMINYIAHSIYVEAPNTDPFWIDSARSLFVGLIHVLFKFGKPDEINIPSVIRLIDEGVGKRSVVKGPLDRIIEEHKNEVFASLLMNVKSAPNETRASILSSTYEPLNIFIKSEGVRDLLCSNEFKISDLDTDKPTAVYIITPDENDIYGSISGIIVCQIMSYFIHLAHKKYNGRLNRRLNFLLEELGNIGKAIPNLPHLMSAGRSRNIRTFIVLQNLSQLEAIYSKSNAITIRSNADTLIAFRTNDKDTLSELSMLCGEREVGTGPNASKEYLITPSQLAAMENGQALIFVSGRIKYVTKLPFYKDIFDYDDWREPDLSLHAHADTNKLFSLADLDEKRITPRPWFDQVQPPLPFDDEYPPVTSGFAEELPFDLDDDDIPLPFDIDDPDEKPSKNIKTVVHVTELSSGSAKDMIIAFANKFRDIPLPRNFNRRFSVQFDDEDKATLFRNFVINHGGMASKTVIDMGDDEDEDIF